MPNTVPVEGIPFIKHVSHSLPLDHEICYLFAQVRVSNLRTVRVLDTVSLCTKSHSLGSTDVLVPPFNGWCF